MTKPTNSQKWLLALVVTFVAWAGHYYFCHHPGSDPVIDLVMFPILVVLGRVYFEYF
jgi:hypothetical protein